MHAAKRRASRMLAITVLATLCLAAGPASGFIVAHWRFDEPVSATVTVDETGGFHGAVVGDATFGAPGMAGGLTGLSG